MAWACFRIAKLILSFPSAFLLLEDEIARLISFPFRSGQSHIVASEVVSEVVSEGVSGVLSVGKSVWIKALHFSLNVIASFSLLFSLYRMFGILAFWRLLVNPNAMNISCSFAFSRKFCQCVSFAFRIS